MIPGEFHPRFQGENFKKNLDLLKEVETIAERIRMHARTTCSCLAIGPRKDIVRSRKKRRFLS